jgi:phosphomannomutase
MVTGSHIPEDRNGIKFYRPDGEILKDDESNILKQVIDFRDFYQSNLNSIHSVPPVRRDIVSEYVARYTNAFGCDALLGKRVGVYQHSAVGRDILVDALASLGADVIPFGRSDSFIPVDTEAVRSEDVEIARKWAAEHQFDAIVSTDGDGDRPLLADEHGEWLRGDVLAMLCAASLKISSVVTPVSSSTVVERSGLFQTVERTRIGSPYVIKAMKAALARRDEPVCGFEANGGFLLGSPMVRDGVRLLALPTRDALLPIIAVLVAARVSSVRSLVESLPNRVSHSDRIQNFAPERRDALMAWLLDDEAERDARLEAKFAPIAEASLLSIDLTDGVRMIFENDRIIHLRGSGNAPELRCYTETEDKLISISLAQSALAIVDSKF